MIQGMAGFSMRGKSRASTTLIGAVCAVALLAMSPAPSAQAATAKRVDLRVLVVDNGEAPVSAIRKQLDLEGVPYTAIDLASPSRSTITTSYLSDQVDGAPRAKFQGVVLPSSQPTALSSDERAAITQFQTDFGIRVVSAYNWANPAIGLNYASYSGPLDGTPATVTAAGLASSFRYLNGPVSFEDNSPSVAESYGYLATPASLPAGSSMTPLVTAAVPGSGEQGVLAGVFGQSGREELVLTFAYNSYQRQFSALAPGIIDWLTRGVHFGIDRKYFAVHVDDVLNSDARWNTGGNCTPEDDCPADPALATTDILMTPTDVSYAQQWQKTNNFKLNMAYNAGPAVQRAVGVTGGDPLTVAFLKDRSQFDWINHTYQHEYLGCIQDFSVTPWRCKTDATGATVWDSLSSINNQFKANIDWATTNRVSIAKNEVVTGEHSGLKFLPQMPVDNPNLAPALSNNKITVLASDASREPLQRAAGSALTLPRYPMNVYYNVGTEAEMTDEFNWIYTSVANGGSGICERNANTSCIDPLPVASGYRNYIIPQEAQIDLRHIMSNDPRPHYVHQSNLAEGRILYPVLERILTDYRSMFAANTPIVRQSMTASATTMKQTASWDAVKNSVTGYIQGGKVTVLAPSGITAPLTVPEGTLGPTGAVFGSAYEGSRSQWLAIGVTAKSLTLNVAPYEAAIAVATTTSSAPAIAPQVDAGTPLVPTATTTGSESVSDTSSIDALTVGAAGTSTTGGSS